MCALCLPFLLTSLAPSSNKLNLLNDNTSGRMSSYLSLLFFLYLTSPPLSTLPQLHTLTKKFLKILKSLRIFKGKIWLVICTLMYEKINHKSRYSHCILYSIPYTHFVTCKQALFARKSVVGSGYCQCWQIFLTITENIYKPRSCLSGA